MSAECLCQRAVCSLYYTSIIVILQVNCSKYLYQLNTGRWTQRIFSFGFKEQLMITSQNVSEVNRERSRLTAASSINDSTKHNGLVVTIGSSTAASQTALIINTIFSVS